MNYDTSKRAERREESNRLQTGEMERIGREKGRDGLVDSCDIANRLMTLHGTCVGQIKRLGQISNRLGDIFILQLVG